ncbi:putative propionyl-CoA carboxylase beta chain 5 [Mycolicibacterium hassiacum DSM 44199]|jgi:propionyl-CoA carboxylase beta chain|uniref:Putative propionyl-CoA carboxylase beta chain 5 n=1 Tax=Mycolicibacterium hassiacum (strain DSM 44199 / CIP 105218 / JCM 12690 / 3849) TaxID=1122247 RepID=K5BH94_MYCHD|nr:acyl-CoA carboxylase subunit beta [Mycolicibacterium hassiacum]EKF24666.1 putative propionyl-CoA carboxylase beta chain 5 [Mycolicibacterium hassiacum DSM 44199]MDA4087003.1 methylmalonyl-CoA carboxyltransferase [Mycolicibacterium hassiacum DSM 44199]PZN18895.1 MAG: acyl-CoA carboxylase subunit beta [Mycolicibacterium hassiacum]VCT88806.1 putative propionyl-CoA carboxylase beta chain 5 [Mycolicibacterium hassiacum DSM 44199]
MTSVHEPSVEPSAEHEIDIHTTAGKLADLRRRTQEAMHPVGEAAIEKVHAKGKLTARERILALLDEGSFVELDQLARHRSTNFGLAEKRPFGDGVVTGYGTIDGREVCIFSQDATVFGGSLGEVYGEKIVKVQELALKTGRPLIGINDGAGARIQEGVVSLGLYSQIFHNNIKASGVIPQISLIMGAAAGGHVYSPALTDFIIMVDQTSQMFITGPDVIKTVTGEDVTMEELGGAHTHMAKSGTVHYVGSGEQDALDFVRDLLSYLPSNNRTDPPRYPAVVPEGSIEDNLTPEDLELDTLIPDSPNQPYDMHEVITRVLDDDEFLEIQAGYAQNIIVGFGRIEGRSVGVVANQPTQFAGCLDINASEKAARFIRTCDCFNIPIVMFVDVPGFLPGTDQEYNGIIRRGAKLLYAYGEASVAKVTVITRKAYGGAYCVMGSKDMGADVAVAWPTAQIAVMGASGAVGFVYRQQLAEAAKKGEDVEALRLKLQQEYEDTLVNPYIAAERGFIDAVIPPSHTRGYVATALRLLERKITQVPPKKHGNIPL